MQGGGASERGGPRQPARWLLRAGGVPQCRLLLEPLYPPPATAGTEPWWYYAANCAINLNLAVPLAAALPAALLLRRRLAPPPPEPGSGRAGGEGGVTRDERAVLVALYAPAALWFAFLSLQVPQPRLPPSPTAP